ncbi:MAG: hypothetical protein ACK4HB_06610 [Candidatus Bipolaricaulia bacterium]
MKTTSYFRASVLARRPYLKMEWIEYVLQHPIRKETQPNGRIRYWAFIVEANKYLRVVTEADGETVHNAFFDRGFKP